MGQKRGKYNWHGLSGHSLYATWSTMNSRCKNAKSENYPRYGGRGIKVCKRWHSNNPNGLKNFIKDMGLKVDISRTLERINNDKGYTPSNCEWATPTKQNNNKTHRKTNTMHRYITKVCKNSYRQGFCFRVMVPGYSDRKRKTLAEAILIRDKLLS